MAAIREKRRAAQRPRRRRLARSRAARALTRAALALPGLGAAGAAAAELESFEWQYSRYEEGDRTLYTPGIDLATGGATDPLRLRSKLDPIEVESLRGRLGFRLSERLGFVLDYTQDSWSGATPIASAPVVARSNTASTVTGASPWADPLGLNTRFFADRELRTYRSADAFARSAGAKDERLVHTLSSASPEVRRQLDLRLGRDFDRGELRVGTGFSLEHDYRSYFASLGGRLDLDQKRTTLDLSLAFTHSQTDARLDPEPAPFVRYRPGETGAVRADRRDVGFQIALSRVLGKNDVLDVGIGYVFATGYLTNPYKLVSGFDIVAPQARLASEANPLFATDLYSVLERRPSRRGLTSFRISERHFISALEAALRVELQHSRDDWGVRSYALSVEWIQALGDWIVTPRVRYYSQDRASFYLPYFATFQVVDAGGAPIVDPLNRAAPRYLSSDHRFAGFGSLGAGLTLSRQLANGVGIEFGYEHYEHAGELRLGGGGHASFADFDADSVNAAVRVEFGVERPIYAGTRDAGLADAAVTAHEHSALPEPAGLLFGHGLGRAGAFSMGYRSVFVRQAGGMRLGTQRMSAPDVVASGCGPRPCELIPEEMTGTMHMLDVMYAPTEWLTLMAMPQWMDMRMRVEDFSSGGAGGHGHGSGAAAGRHEAGGFGDTLFAALLRVADRPGDRVQLGLGISAPTGDSGIRLRKTGATYAENQVTPSYLHYGMQLGSGTWDFTPSLTYAGERGATGFGAQLSGVVRMQKRNDAGFAFGDVLQASVWGVRRLAPWLSATLRSSYSLQGDIEGGFGPPRDAAGNALTPVHQGPMDRPANYGGQFVDVGVGLGVRLTERSGLNLEWQIPVHTDFEGVQLDRSRTITLRFDLGM